ncbi:MAG TPA: hypothetical protein VEV81_14725, partial [Pyrinomonadaceae bacterium]|nr:hypothetical protein [Pyrinomonadaceae bacterium]
LERDFQVCARRAWELGGPYFTTPGVTPEIVHPYVVEVEASCGASSALRFINVEGLAGKLDLLQDAHLLIAACRLIHALGPLP